METNTQLTHWTHLSSNPNAEFSLPRWISFVGASEVERLTADNVMTDLSDEELDGRKDQFEVGFGLRTYELHFDNGTISALSDGPESPVKVSRESVRFLRFSRSRFLRLLAERNGFTPIDGPEEILPGIFQVGTLVLAGNRTISWLICFDVSFLRSRAAFLLAKEKAINGGIVVLSTPNPDQPPSTDWARERSFVFSEIPNGLSRWMTDARHFCNPILGFRSQDVSAHLAKYSGIDLLIDDEGGKIFLFGKDLDLKKNSRPFNYLAKLSRFPDTDEPMDQFAQKSLNYGSKYERSWIYDDQKGVKNAIRAQIKDQELQKRALALFESPATGKIRLPLKSDQILYWA